MNSVALPELLELSIADRIRLVESLWESIAKDAAAIPLTDWQRRELDACLEEYGSDPENGEPWRAVKAELMKG